MEWLNESSMNSDYPKRGQLFSKTKKDSICIEIKWGKNVM